MSDQIPVGREGNEIAHGYTPLKDPKPEEKTYGDGHGFDGVREAASDLAASRTKQSGPMPIEYQTERPDGTREKIEGKFAVTPDKAARDLSAFHRQQAAEADNEADVDLLIAAWDAQAEAKAARDDLRPVDWQQQQQPAQQRPEPQKPEGAQPEATQQPADGIPQHVREALAIPEVRAAIEQEIGQAQHMRAAFAQAIGDVQRLAAATVVSTVPELRNVPPDQLPGALAMLQAKDPQRHAQVMGQIQTVHALQQQSAAIERENAAQYQQRFNQWANEQDQLFEKQNPEFSDPNRAKQARGDVMRYLTEVRGIPAPTLEKLWQTDLFRDAIAQGIMMDAARWHWGQEKARSAVPANVPAPQRPGVSNGIRPDNSEDLARARARLRNSRGQDSLSNAVRLLHAQRANAR